MISSISDNFQELIVESYKKAPISRCKVISNSMFPLLSKGDWIIVKSKFNNEEIKPGVILLYHLQNKFIVHRIVRIDQNGITTKGDFSCYLDPPITREQVIGIVIAVKKANHSIPFNHPFIKVFNQIMTTINRIYTYLNYRR